MEQNVVDLILDLAEQVQESLDLQREPTHLRVIVVEAVEVNSFNKCQKRAGLAQLY